MSGFLTSTGMLTNEGKNFLDIQNDLDKKIDSIVIHNIPLSQSNSMTALRTIGKLFTPLIHSALTPTFSHIAIELIIKESDFLYIIEYGQYYSKDSKIKNSVFSSSSSNEPRKNTNNHDYYYINEDGARLTRISKEEIRNILKNDPNFLLLNIFADKEVLLPEKNKLQIYRSMNNIITKEIAKGFYGEIKDKNIFEELSNDFKRVECNVKNKITLKELCNILKMKNGWPKNTMLLVIIAKNLLLK